MTKSQNTKNEQQKDLCITSEQLTEMMKTGDLPHDVYYVICSKNDTVEIVRNWVQTASCLKPTISYEFPSDLEVKQILAPVPSYDELQNMNEAVNQAMSANIKLVEQNAQLKELLKECKTPLEVYNEMFGNKEELLTKIDEALR